MEPAPHRASGTATYGGLRRGGRQRRRRGGVEERSRGGGEPRGPAIFREINGDQLVGT